MREIATKKMPAPEMLNCKEWQSFIEGKANELLDTYKVSPDRLHQDAMREKRTQQDYSGREFLELFQNADDAATEANISGRIRIEVLSDGFLFANTGRPFSMGGVRSILMADLSPKQKCSNLLIGAKGLGFRSMLNWTESPAILSGALEVGFSRSHSWECFAALAKEIPKLKRDFQKKDLEPPILCFPEWLNENKERAYDILLKRAHALRKDGFDTVIVAPFQKQSSLDEAIEQAKDLGARLLLFVQSIREVEIQIVGEPDCKWVRDDGDCVRLQIIQGDIERSEEWLLRRERNRLPDDICTDKDARKDYEIAVALRVDDPYSTEPISCYFPTREEMPFVGLFHATLELQGNREHLRRKSKVNKYILERLGELHAGFLEHLARTNWLNDPLDFMNVDQMSRETLEPFVDAFYRAAAGKKLVPTRGKGFVVPAEAKMFPFCEDDFADRRWFRDFVPPHTEASRQVLERLSVAEATQDDVVMYLSELKMTLKKRAGLIADLSKLDYDTPLLGRLFLDDRNKQGDEKTKWFPSLAGIPVSSVPRWAKFRFVHPDLWRAICHDLGVESDAAISNLCQFSVEKYDPRSVIEALLSRLDGLAQSPNAKISDRRTEFLNVLSTIFQGPKNALESLAEFEIPWPNIAGEWSLAKNLHLCDDQSKSGPINRHLYENRPDLLATDPDVLSISLPAGKNAEFLMWIGVNEWPGKVWRDLNRNDWGGARAGLPDTLTYKYQTGKALSVSVADADFATHEVSTGFNGCTEWILGLSDILECGCDDAILAWLTYDRKMRQYFCSEINFKPAANSGRHQVKGEIEPSLVTQMINQFEWLRDCFGVLQGPRDFFTGEDFGCGILPLPRLPNMIGPLRFKMTHNDALTGCKIAGAAAGLDTATPQTICRLLKTMGMAKPDPKVVLRIYRKLSQRSDLDGDVKCKERDEFLRQGMLLSSEAGETAWCSPAKTIHVSDSSAIMGIIEKARPVFKLSEAPKRFLDFLGVPQFEPQKISIKDVKPQPGSPEITRSLEQRFDGFIRWLVLWGEQGNASQKRLASINLIRPVAVSELSVALELGTESYEENLREWECLYDSQKIYIVVPRGVDVTVFEDLASAPFTRCLAQHLGMPGADKLADLFRSRSPEARKVLILRAFPELSFSDIEENLGRNLNEFASSIARNKVNILPPLVIEENSLDELEDPGVAEIDALRQRVASKKKAELGDWKSKTVMDPVPKEKATFRVGGRSSKRSHLVKQSSGQDEERIVKQFETKQGRFCVRVDRERGEASEGCDIVSFTSKIDLDEYCRTRDSTLVARFIEVKGGAMDLSVNERKSAKRNQDRFYVYSVQNDEEGQHTIKMFCDPLKWSVEDDWFLRVNRKNAPSSHMEVFVCESVKEDWD